MIGPRDCGLHDDDHRCPLLPLTDDEAIRVLVELLRTSTSSSEVVERLGRRGYRVGRVPA